MPASFSLRSIAARLGGEVVGDAGVVVQRVASLANAGPGDLSFITGARYQSQLDTTRAAAIVVPAAGMTALPCIVTDNPYAYFARAAALLNPAEPVAPGVDAAARVDPSAQIPTTCSIAAGAVIGRRVRLGEEVAIGAGCVIGDDVVIGAQSRLHARVTVYAGCELGQRCVVQSGCVIGAGGFGYAHDNGRWIGIPQVGRVLIGDDVEIGANTTIDRGTLDDTVIEEGVKMDNLIQIGHNCVIGAHSVIAGCVGIAGSARIGRKCRIGGAAMILGHLDIADDVTVSPGSMITRSLVQPGTYTALMPFQTHGKWLKTAAQLRHLDGMAERILRLEQEFDERKKKEPS